MATVGLSTKGEHLTLKGDEASGVGAEDSSNYRDYRKVLQQFSKTLEPFWLKTLPRIGTKALPELITFAHLGLKMRMLGKKDMGEFMRVATLPARDLMDENF